MAGYQQRYIRQNLGGGGVTVSDWSRVTEHVESMCNPNLLINTDFTNPVNQRGRTEYSELGYTIDMWRFERGTATIKIGDQGITITNTITNIDDTFVWSQPIEPKRLKLGEIYTLSVELSDGTIKRMSLAINENIDSPEIVLKEKCFVDIYWINPAHVDIRIFGNMDGSISIKSIKLERGTVSTLANEVVDYAAELIKCQRYFYRQEYSLNQFYVGIAIATEKNKVYQKYSLPVEMRLPPTVSYGGVIYMAGTFDTGQTLNHTISGIGIYGVNNKKEIILYIQVEQGDLMPFENYLIYGAERGAYLELSAEL